MRVDAVDRWRAEAIKATTPTADSERIRQAIVANGDDLDAGTCTKQQWTAKQRRLWDDAYAIGCSKAVAYALSRSGHLQERHST